MNKKELILNMVNKEINEYKRYRVFAITLLDRRSYKFVKAKSALLKTEYSLVNFLYDRPKEKMDTRQVMVYDRIIGGRTKQLEKTEPDIEYELYMERVIITSFINYLSKTIIPNSIENKNYKLYINMILLVRFLKSIDKYDTSTSNLNKLRYIQTIYKNEIDKFQDKVRFGEVMFGIDF